MLTSRRLLIVGLMAAATASGATAEEKTRATVAEKTRVYVMIADPKTSDDFDKERESELLAKAVNKSLKDEHKREIEVIWWEPKNPGCPEKQLLVCDRVRLTRDLRRRYPVNFLARTNHENYDDDSVEPWVCPELVDEIKCWQDSIKRAANRVVTHHDKFHRPKAGSSDEPK